MNKVNLKKNIINHYLIYEIKMEVNFLNADLSQLAFEKILLKLIMWNYYFHCHFNAHL